MRRVNAYALPVLTTLGLLTPGPGYAQFGDWPAIFDPTILRTLNLSMEANDWTTVQTDETLSVAVPAMFWADGEDPIWVAVRRKSGDPLMQGLGYTKVSLKIDINELVPGQSWHGLKKLSLENGDDQDVVSEGLAWEIERFASRTQGYAYPVGYRAWVRLFINGVDTGVYLNVEQVDKRFLENRGLYAEGLTWLYKVSDVGSQELKEGGPQESPTVESLCYLPFEQNGSCPQPDLATHVPQYVNMKGILTLMASDAFQTNGDAMLTKGKNFYFLDFLDGTPRMYFPWDRDSSLSGGSVNDSIYAGSSPYATLLTVPEFRASYNEIINDLICGPWSSESLIAFLDAVEPVLTDALAADPNNRISDSIAGHFDKLRNWAVNRAAIVMGQLEGFQICPSIQVDLNEIMASNTTILEDPQEPGEYPDWFEIHNPSPDAVDLGGLYLTDDISVPTKYQIPAGTIVPGNGYLVFWADDDGTQGPLHTNFTLAAEGEEVCIFDVNGVNLIDSIQFWPQIADVSFGRYPDGAGAWGHMAAPTAGAPNSSHNAPPVISGTARTPELPASTNPVWVSASVTDEMEVVGVTLRYDVGGGWIDVPMSRSAGSSTYTGQIPAFGNGTVVKYYVVAWDDLGGERRNPVQAPAFTYSYYVGYTPLPLYINEFVADNDTVIEDPQEPLAYEDWIELYNAGPTAMDLGGMYLTDDLDYPLKFQIPAGVVLPGGGRLIFWADNDPEQGALHTNFKLTAFGEQIGLHDTDAYGNMRIDALWFGPQTTDVSTGRCPDGSSGWTTFTSATPGRANASCPDDGGALANASADLRNGFATLDASGDGRLSFAEATAAGGVPSLSTSQFASIDTDQDYGLTIEELLEISVGAVGVTTQVWVDFAYTGVESGTDFQPFNSLLEGASFVANSGTVTLSGGYSAELLTIQKPMRLQAVGGGVRIGISN